jgi:hypothetical protein
MSKTSEPSRASASAFPVRRKVMGIAHPTDDWRQTYRARPYPATRLRR